MLVPAITAGDLVVRLIEQCVDSDQPLLLIGPHGVGKSDLFKTAARRIGIGFISRDLSVMEPSDLIGIPRVDEAGRTRFAAPAFLPTEGRGLLTIEEINRAPRYMVAPCLQLLTERRLNDYVLPPGWIPMASMNPGGEDYHVDDLDPALLSRFVQAEIRADVKQWAYWARGQGKIHPKVIEFAEQSPGIFDSGETNPRALAYLSRQVSAWESKCRDSEILLLAAAGLIGETWAVTFNQFLHGGEAPLSVSNIVDDYKRHKAKFAKWVARRQLDLVRASMNPIRRFLDEQANYQALTSEEKKLQNVRKFIADLPADLGKELRDWLAEKNYDSLV